MNGKLWKNSLQKIWIGCMIGIMILMSGCSSKAEGKVTDEESALNFLQSLEGYEAQVNVVFFSNRGEKEYVVHQRVRADGQYRLEILEPEAFRGVITVCDGTQIQQSDPTIGGGCVIAIFSLRSISSK